MRAVFTRVSRDRTLEAEQLTEFHIPECVEQCRVGLTSQLVYTFRGPFGACLIPRGTWIVYDLEGARPVPQKVFEQHYRPVTVAGRALAFGERVRKILVP